MLRELACEGRRKTHGRNMTPLIPAIVAFNDDRHAMFIPSHVVVAAIVELITQSHEFWLELA